MKKIIFAAAALVMLSACNQAELDRSNTRNDSLISVISEREKVLDERETSLNEFINSFNEVERNLDCVAVRQKIVRSTAESTKGDLPASQKERINQHIMAINDLMESNRKAMADLRRSLKSSNSKNKKLEETILALNERLQQRESELTALNEKLNLLNDQLATLQTKFDTLTLQNEMQSKDISEKTMELHTAYYVVGKAKDLREAKVIDKKGGLLGIGKTAQLDENFNRNKFTRIDYTQTNMIPVNSDKVKIVTNHPKGSYDLETVGNDKDKVRNLVIKDPERFWSVSKYLVIVGVPVQIDDAVSKQPIKENQNVKL